MHLPSAESALDDMLTRIVKGSPVILLILGYLYIRWFHPDMDPLREDPLFREFASETNTVRSPRSTTARVPLTASDHINDGKHHLLLAATGSVATIKLPKILQALSKHPNLSIRILLTESAAEFLQSQADEQPSLASLSKIPNVDAIYRDADEWRKPWIRGDPILHIELRRWADLMAVVPLSANSLAKLANGYSDNLFSSVARAWDATGTIDAPRPGVQWPYLQADGERKKGIVVAPAMNTAMWEHPATAKHVRALEEEWGVQRGGWIEVLRPIEKGLACGDTGSGAMKDWKDIVGVIEQRLELGPLIDVKS